MLRQGRLDRNMLNQNGKVRVCSLFSGIGGFELGIINAIGARADFVAYSEINPYAIKVYERHFNGHKNYGDITRINTAELPDFDLLVGGFPCFVAGTMVLTKTGLKNIEDVNIGDYVLTHRSRWRRVINKFRTENRPVRLVQSQGMLPTGTTDEHPYYSRAVSQKWDNSKRAHTREFSKPNWAEAKDIKGLYLCKNIPPEQDAPGDEDFWWIVGRYIADGWLVNRRDRGDGGIARVVISAGRDKADNLESRINRKFGCTKVPERTATKFHITNKEFARFLEQFGRGASNKSFSEYLTLPTNKANALLEGYLSGDGSSNDREERATTTSKELAIGLTYLFLKCRGRMPTITKTVRPTTAVIEGRVVNQKDTYTVTCPKNNRSAFIENNAGWGLCRKSEPTSRRETVYNIEVEEDNSYTANGVVVHNCQAFSISGKRGGFNDTRGTLFFEVARILRDKRPRYFVLENVKGLLSHDSGKTFQTILRVLAEAGYGVSWSIHNTKDYGLPQNRERVYIIGCLGDPSGREVFPIRQNSQSPTSESGRSEPQAKPASAIKIPEATKQGYAEATIGDSINLSQPNSTTRRGRVGKNIANTLDTGIQQYTIHPAKPIQITGGSQGNRVYDPEGTSVTIASQAGGLGAKTGLYAMSGRENGQQLEPSGDFTNTLTSVAKDNLWVQAVGLTRREPNSHRVRKDQRVGTLDASYYKGLANQERPGAKIGTRIRRLTPTECARLQGFPDDWCSELSDTQQYACYGNAVSVPVVEHIIRSLLRPDSL